MKNYLILFILIMSFNRTHAASFLVDTKKSHISFVAKGKPAFISISGKSPYEETKLWETTGLLSGELIIDLNDISTGIELRDEHLKIKYLETPLYPKAILSISEIDLKALTDEVSFTGKLKLHGVEKEIKGMAHLVKKNIISASFSINLNDFKIEIPSFQGITVAETVMIKTLIELVELP